MDGLAVGSVLPWKTVTSLFACWLLKSVIFVICTETLCHASEGASCTPTET